MSIKFYESVWIYDQLSCNETIPAKVVGAASGLAFDPKFFGISRRGDSAVRSEEGASSLGKIPWNSCQFHKHPNTQCIFACAYVFLVKVLWYSWSQASPTLIHSLRTTMWGKGLGASRRHLLHAGAWFLLPAPAKAAFENAYLDVIGYGIKCECISCAELNMRNHESLSWIDWASWCLEFVFPVLVALEWCLHETYPF